MRSVGITAFALAALITTAEATTGPGCLTVVNVQRGDFLALRAAPSPNARLIDRLYPGEHGIIKLEAACEPLSRPWGQRWCEVTHFQNASKTGYVKARFVRDQDCP